MTALIVGLLLFLGLHSIRFIADGARSRFIEQRGLKTWRALYSVVSGIGFVLIIWGYSLTLRQPVVLYEPAPWTRALAGVLTLAAIVLITASFVPRNLAAWAGFTYSLHARLIGVAPFG